MPSTLCSASRTKQARRRRGDPPVSRVCHVEAGQARTCWSAMASNHERRNREFWDADADDYQAAHATDLRPERARASGVWRIPDAELGILGPVRDLDVLEYGCGAAQWSIALAQDG